jgi:hypothetical protein
MVDLFPSFGSDQTPRELEQHHGLLRCRGPTTVGTTQARRHQSTPVAADAGSVTERDRVQSVLSTAGTAVWHIEY